MTPGLADLRNVARTLLITRAHDVTSKVATRSALIVAPHPDDETIGCGARILLARRAGADIWVVVLTDGGSSLPAAGIDTRSVAELRSAELTEATHRLDVPASAVFRLDYPDGALADHAGPVRGDLARLIDELRPDDIYVTCADEWHSDHAAASAAVRSVLEELERPPRLLEYPIWLWMDWPVSARLARGAGVAQWFDHMLRRRVEVVSVDSVRTGKRAALAAYGSQIGGPRRMDQRDTGTENAPPGLAPELVARAIEGPELYFRPRPTRSKSRSNRTRRGLTGRGLTGRGLTGRGLRRRMVEDAPRRPPAPSASSEI